jgi:hypothetical protein
VPSPDEPQIPSTKATDREPLTRRSFLATTAHTAALGGALALVPIKLLSGCDASTDEGDEVQSLAASPIDLSCDVMQGFNFRTDITTQIGFITALKIGDEVMTADITCKDPLNNANDKKVVGVMSYCGWIGAATDPLNMNVLVSETAKNKVDTLTKMNMSNVEVDVTFDCYDYDPVEATYYKRFHSGEATLKGLIYGQGDDLAIRIVLEPNAVVQEPRNYTLSLGIKPQPSQQELHYAGSAGDEVAMQWGVTED